ncbi:MAG TPA: DUF3445 domain-containing protein [Acidimicrobiales bacterium]|nr:DUF3445 domain-containing protein [Acidimicrobiales bacterium]
MSTPYVPLDGRDWRFTMGLRPLEESRWLEFDEHAESELAQKRALLSENRSEVVATLPNSQVASAELLEMVVEHLATYFPERDRRATREHPVVAASRLAQEDFCVLERSDTWRLSAACVCFPSRWSLASKLGATLDAIHAPVPLYDEQLAAPTNAFFDRLSAERSYWRLNWTLLDSPVLHQPGSSRRPPGGDLADWFFRVERQTLRRLFRSDSIVFTIRTYVESADALARRDEEFLPALLRALRTAPPEVQDYKGWRGVAERLAGA